ncbi:MAG: NrsF family protein [Halieaceae bacterium]
MTSRDDLITALSSDLAPVKPVAKVEAWAFAWLAVSALYVVGIIHLLGPIRPEALDQLSTHYRFLGEMVLGFAAIVFLVLGAFRAAVPGLPYRRLTAAGSILSLLWVASFLVGLEWPALEASMSGKRHYCVIETFLYAIPPVLLAFFVLRRFYPLNPTAISAMICLAAGMLPAVYMQIACMYVPIHILKFHVLPALLVGGLGALVVFIATQRMRNDGRNN